VRGGEEYRADAFCEPEELGGEKGSAARGFEPTAELFGATNDEKECGAEDGANAEDEPVAQEILRPIVPNGEAGGLERERQGEGESQSRGKVEIAGGPF